MMSSWERYLYNRPTGAVVRRESAMVRLITPALYRAMPWKNGGGLTTEIASYPCGAALETFAWRVSIAEIECEGPFSRFPGLVTGERVRRERGPQFAIATTATEPHAGALEQHAALAIAIGIDCP